MKKTALMCMLGVAVVFLCASPSSAAAGDDYVITELDDPLQPVWDRLDNLGEEVSDPLKRSMESQFSALNIKIDSKARALTSTINEVKEKVMTLVHLTNGNMGWDPHFIDSFIEHSRAYNNEAVTKIERHIDNQIANLETRIKEYIDAKLLLQGGQGSGGGSQGGGQSVGEGAASITETLRSNSATLANINTHVLKINEKLGEEEGDTCAALVDKVSELMSGTAVASGQCPGLTSESVRALSQLSKASSAFLPRDCSDKHWQEPEAPSGVFETFPTLDPKAPVNAYCDMGRQGARETGGWTVILRRQNSTYGLVNFNRTWEEYRRGFGEPGEGEWWYGLSPLHALTYRQPFEVDLLMHDIQRGTFNARYTTFRVESEAEKYKLILNGFSGNVTHDALTSKHHGSTFTTWDKDHDEWGSGNCAQSNGGGWWFNACHYTTLTAPFPTSTNREAKTIRWLEDDWLVLDDVTLKIRPANYAQRFNEHKLSG